MLAKQHLPRTLFAFALLCSAGCARAQTAALPEQTARLGPTSAPIALVTSFDKPYLFVYSEWNKDNAQIQNGVLTLNTVTGKGGLGDNIQLNLAGQPATSPMLKLRLGPNHKAKTLRLTLRDAAERSSTWDFDLTKLPREQNVVATPKNGAPLGSPNSFDSKGAADLSAITQWQVQGDWSGDAFDVQLQEVALVEPTPEMLAMREARKTKLAQQAEAKRVAKENALKNIRHTADSPTIERVYAAAPDIIGVQIQDGQMVASPRVPYIKQDGDEVRLSGNTETVIKDGEIAKEKEERALYRAGKRVGTLVGGRDGKYLLLPVEKREGDKLELLTVDDASSYQINGAAPLAVYRKSKPNDKLWPNNEQLISHTVYLQLAQPLVAGKQYEIEFPGVNTARQAASFTHQPAQNWSEGVHASQIGYRADDPFKRAFYSLWLGTGGAYSLPDPPSFSIVDAQGKSVFKGQARLAMAADGTEQLREKKNYAQTAVYALDFSEFQTPGAYRVCVDGIGCSYPFSIGDDVWARAFRVGMKGLLHHRSGLALEKPWADIARPRDLHPADGFRVYQTTANRLKVGNGSGEAFKALVNGRTDEVLPDAWGSYHDAGDFDRAALHLWRSTLLPLELIDVYPAYFKSFKLSLPPAEAGNNIPDILDEALWSLKLFRQTQKADGGIIGGVESSAHPRPGETADIESLILLAYAPDVQSSYRYAAAAAKTARLLAPYDAAQSRELSASAIRAWDYAEANRAAQLQGVKKDEIDNTAANRNEAAAELLWLTGKAEYNAAFAAEAPIAKGENLGGPEWQFGAFTYARLPGNLGDGALKRKIVAQFRQGADVAIKFAQNNAFGLTTDIAQLPEMGYVGYWSVPGMLTQIVPRAYLLTGDEKYLAGTLRAANFSAGAGPDNMTFTTGLGAKFPRAPLHLDSRNTGQAAPSGITVYGQSEPARGDAFSDWVHTYYIGETTTPNSRTWPGPEAYVDLYLWPAMNEYTIHQTMAPSSYVWGVLAARE